MEMLKILKKEAPEFFLDFRISEDGRAAHRKGSKYSRNKYVNWSLPPGKRGDYGIDEVKQVPHQETEIP